MPAHLVPTLAGRLHLPDVHAFCRRIEGADGEVLFESLFRLVDHADERVGYNVLWIFSHLRAPADRRLQAKRDAFVDRLLATRHAGRRRLLLALLLRLPAPPAERLRTDLIDFCFDGILSTEPYAIRAQCLKLGFTLCRPYPELLQELQVTAECMQSGPLSPALAAARRQVLARIARLRRTH